MSLTTSSRAGGVAPDDAPDARLREPRQMVESNVRLFAFAGGMFMIQLALIGGAGGAS